MKLLSVWLIALISVSVNVKAADEEWWRSGVFYQIYPRSFMDADDSGEGDVKGIISKLEHLKDLGVTGAWLNPIFVSPMKDGGYDIEDFYNIDKRYGNNTDLEDLFKRAKELGIRILLDLVPNHTSDQHEWFIKSARREPGFEDFYVWKDCTAVAIPVNGTFVYEVTNPPNNWIAVFHTIAWSYHPIRQQCYLHQFLAAQPDLNYHNPNVTVEMFEVLKYWMDKGADGFRIDAINHMFEAEDFANETYIDPNGDRTSYENLYHNLTKDLDGCYEVVFDWRRQIDEYTKEKGYDRKFLMTEAYTDYDLQIKWYGNETVPGSHMPFNFALISNLDRDSNAQDFDDAVQAWYSRLPKGFGAEANWVLGNHDRPRIGYRYGINRHESLALMTMLLPGINVVYYGEEILMTDNRAITWEETDDPAACQTNRSVYQEHTRDPVRTPFQWDETTHAGFSKAEKTWLPVNENYQTVNLKAEKAATKSTFKFYQEIIKLRKTKIFQEGTLRTKAVTPTVFSYARMLDNEDTVVVFINLGSDTKLNASLILEASEFPENAKGKILAATSTSTYNVGDNLNPYEFELKSYDAIAFVVGGGASIIASFLLISISVLVILF